MPLWRVDEAAEFLGIRPKTLYEWVRTGRVPHRKIGFNVRFDPGELEAWAAAQAEGPSATEDGDDGRTPPAGPSPGDAAALDELCRAAHRAAEVLRHLQRDVGTQLSYPKRREIEELAQRLEEAAATVEIRGPAGP